MEKKIILASASPRRRELIQLLRRLFEVRPAQGEEFSEKTQPKDYVQELALLKAREVYERLSDEEAKESMVIGADTIVVLDDRILGKPKDHEDAVRMLSDLAGRAHRVLTGVAFIDRDEAGQTQSRCFFEETIVHVCALTQEEIEAYLSTGDAYDKAGAYGIQGPFGIHISGIEGDYQNVVGLPISRIYREMKLLH